jgi:hypothetical protein
MNLVLEVTAGHVVSTVIVAATAYQVVLAQDARLSQDADTVSVKSTSAPSIEFATVADDGVPVHELQLLAGHASITTTQRYMNARASSLAESMRQARTRRVTRLEHSDEASVQIG